MNLFRITVAEENGTIVDTGWVAMEIPLVPANAPSPLPIAGAALYDAVLQHGLNYGICDTKEEATS